jgi:hypothetical protein
VADTRPEWEECHDPKSLLVNFKWQQGIEGYKYERLIVGQTNKQLVNHFEHHRELSNKQYLLKKLNYLPLNVGLLYPTINML